VQLYVPLRRICRYDVFLVVRPTAGRRGGIDAAVRRPSPPLHQLVSVRDIRTLDDIARAATAVIASVPVLVSLSPPWRSSGNGRYVRDSRVFGRSTCVISASAWRSAPDE